MIRGDRVAGEPEMTNMLFIEGGTFRMGDMFREGIELATPVHEVTVSSFYLNRHEVTVGEFSEFVAKSGYLTSAETGASCETPPGKVPSSDENEYEARLASPGAWVLNTPSEGPWTAEANWKNPQFEQSPSDPVVCVSWRDATSYCNWLSVKAGLPAGYDIAAGRLVDDQGQPTTDISKVRGYRLPSEAEWEYAARERGRNVRFGNGQNVATSSDMNINDAEGESRRRTMPVGSFRPNSLGLHDMSGNVWEWCSDFLDRYEAAPQHNPYQTKGWVAEDRCNNIGFRIARSE